MRLNIICLTIVMAITAIFPASASADKIDPTEVAVKKPGVLNMAGEEVGVPENPVVNPNDLPKVHMFGRLDRGQFDFYVLASSSYLITEPAKAKMIRNGIGPTTVRPPQFSQIGEGPNRWWYKPAEGADHHRPVASLPPGTYTYILELPYKDTGIIIRYESEEFEVPHYSAYAESCLYYQKGGEENIFTRVQIFSLGRLPTWVWASFDGKTEARHDIRRIENHHGFVDTLTTPAKYWSRVQLDLRMPDGTEISTNLFHTLAPCGKGDEEDPTVPPGKG